MELQEKEEDLLFVLIDSMIFLSPFLDVTKMSMLNSLIARLDPEILCL